MGIQQRVAQAFAENSRLDINRIPDYPKHGTALDYVIAVSCGAHGAPAQEKHCEVSRMPLYKTRHFRLWTYDVWGNAREGFDVNDRYSHGTVSIRCKREVYNPGSPMQFVAYDPTDRQLSRAAGFTRVEWDGSDGAYTAQLKSNGRPIGELCEQEAQS
jgi:hypothetical protein